ncbi:MAG: low molecular weight phosphotyrosine protein phosphatase [Chlorobi bacterium]|nr:low molecular weight phosphotyrosine protein phosphatase [Chlorobiota bacterium]
MSRKKILFVCLGNICRSPSAEAVFKALVGQKGMAGDFVIDSAGTYAYHEGERADRRMQQHAIKRGYDLTSISRPFDPSSDWDDFDFIVAMDDNNFNDLRAMARSGTDIEKLYKITDFSNKFNCDHVPDPYYGGPDGFDLVLDILEDAGEGFFNFLIK